MLQARIRVAAYSIAFPHGLKGIIRRVYILLSRNIYYIHKCAYLTIHFHIYYIPCRSAYLRGGVDVSSCPCIRMLQEKTPFASMARFHGFFREAEG